MRFSTAEKNDVYYVQDTQWRTLYQPDDMAVRLFFATRVQAQRVAEILNQEWKEFLKNPNK